jgi:hypothetical protein
MTWLDREKNKENSPVIIANRCHPTLKRMVWLDNEKKQRELTRGHSQSMPSNLEENGAGERQKLFGRRW